MGAMNSFLMQPFSSSTSIFPKDLLTQLLTGSKPLGATASGEACELGPLCDGETSDVSEITGQGDIEDAFNGAVYRSQMERVSMSLAFQQVSAQVSGTNDEGGTASAELVAQQLQFEFMAESRVEELAVFSRRTGAVAEGLEGEQQESFVATSQRVAARFSMSVQVSSAVLTGFAGAAEELQGGEAAGMDDLLGFTNDALDEVNEIMNQLFGLVNDLLTGEGDFETRFGQFLQGLEDLGFLSGVSDAFGTSGTTGTQAANGAQLQVSQFSMQLEFEFEYTEVTAIQGAVQESDPIVLDLDGDGIELTNYANGAQFDIEGSGNQVTTAFVTGGDAFLAIDRNGNGTIDSGRELFGDQNGAANGFEELRKLDSNGDGRINAADQDFDQLLLWRDDGDGVTEEGELISLEQAGVDEIQLGYRNVDDIAAGGNRLGQIASFLRSDGTRGRAADAILNFIA